jgi:hypothetical protein
VNESKQIYLKNKDLLNQTIDRFTREQEFDDINLVPEEKTTGASCEQL